MMSQQPCVPDGIHRDSQFCVPELSKKQSGISRIAQKSLVSIDRMPGLVNFKEYDVGRYIDTLDKNQCSGSALCNRRETICPPKRASRSSGCSGDNRRHTIAPTKPSAIHHKVATRDLYSQNRDSQFCVPELSKKQSGISRIAQKRMPGLVNSKNYVDRCHGTANLHIGTLDKKQPISSALCNRRETIGPSIRASCSSGSSYENRRSSIVPTNTYKTRHNVTTGLSFSQNRGEGSMGNTVVSSHCPPNFNLSDCDHCLCKNCNYAKENRRPAEIFNVSHHLKSPSSDYDSDFLRDKCISELEVSSCLGESPLKMVWYKKQRTRETCEKFTSKSEKKGSDVSKHRCHRNIFKTKNCNDSSFSLLDEAEQKVRFKQKEMDILYNNYIQTLYLDKMMQKAIQKREADAARQIQDFHNLTQSDNEKALDLQLKQGKIYHNRLVTHFGELQRNAVSKVNNSLSDMKSKHHNLAEVLDTVPHQIATEGIFHPNDETYIDDLTNNFIETEQRLEKINDVTESKMPSLSSYNSHLKHLVETVSTENSEIEQINELLGAVDSLTIQQISQTFQHLEVNSKVFLDI